MTNRLTLPTPLVSTNWLAEHLGDPDLRVVPKLDRLARSVPDARDIGGSMIARGIKLSLGGSLYDPADRWARCSSTSSPPSPSSKEFRAGRPVP
jgi:hypothetical protein